MTTNLPAEVGSTATGSEVSVAHELATRAAGAHHVIVRELGDIAELQGAAEIWHRVWGTAEGSVNHDVLRAISFAGNYVAGAYAGNELVGAAVAFRGHRPGQSGHHLHSHVVGVLASARGKGVGLSLKLHQRAWSLQQGLDRIEWTFDPLQRRNAIFNIERLGALPAEYHPDFYGPLRDSLNEGVPTDRLLVRWDLLGVPAARALGGLPIGPDPQGCVWLLEESAAGTPRRRGLIDAPHLAVAVPTDINELRRRDPALAEGWRRELGDAIAAATAAGYHFSGMAAREGYLLSVAGNAHSPRTETRS